MIGILRDHRIHIYQTTKKRTYFSVTKNTVPPPGWVGTCARFNNRRLITNIPGAPGPPTNLCGEKNTAS